MTKEMYTTPDMVVVEFGQEDVVCGTASVTAPTDPDTGDFEGGDGE